MNKRKSKSNKIIIKPKKVNKKLQARLFNVKSKLKATDNSIIILNQCGSIIIAYKEDPDYLKGGYFIIDDDIGKKGGFKKWSIPFVEQLIESYNKWELLRNQRKEIIKPIKSKSKLRKEKVKGK